MTRTDAEQFIRKLKDSSGHTGDLEHVSGDMYAVRITTIQLTISTPKQARFVLKYIKPRT